MDRLDCHAIYVDKRAHQDRFLEKPALLSLDYLSHMLHVTGAPGSDIRDTLINLKVILAVFPSGKFLNLSDLGLILFRTQPANRRNKRR